MRRPSPVTILYSSMQDHMQGKAPRGSLEILQAATHYSSVIPAEVYITMPDVVPISLALYHKSVGLNVEPMRAGTSHGKDRMKQKGRKGADTTLGSIDIADVGRRARRPNKGRIFERLQTA